MGARKGDNLGALLAQHQQAVQASQSRKQQQEMQAFQMEQMKRQQAEMEQRKQLAARAFAPGAEAQGPMPDGVSPNMVGQGGGLPEYAQGLMGMGDIGGALDIQSRLQKQGPKYHSVGGALVEEPTAPGGAARPVYTAPAKPEGPKKGELRKYDHGQNTLTYEFDGSEWKMIGRAPRFKEDGPDKPPAGYRPDGKGGLTFIPGGPADPTRPGAKTPEHPTEDERRSAGLAVRLDSALKTIKANPEAGKPEMIPSAIRAATFGSAEALPNALTTTSRQKVESAQLDALDAALTLATGAAYTRDQLQNLRKSYFPQLGDRPETIAEKEKRFEEVLQTARIRAGRASKSIDQQGQKPGWSITKIE